MQDRHLHSAAASDRTFIAILAACTTFVVGYTTVRVSLAQNNVSDNTGQGTVQQTVIPHQATLWNAVGE